MKLKKDRIDLKIHCEIKLKRMILKFIIKKVIIIHNEVNKENDLYYWRNFY